MRQRDYESSLRGSIEYRTEATPDINSHPESPESRVRRTRDGPKSRRSDKIVKREFYSQHKLCYITPIQSPFLKLKGGGVLMATKKAAKKPAKKAAKKK